MITPLTQALNEGKLSRAELRRFMQRSDAPAFRHLALWCVVLALTGGLVWAAWDSWLIWPAMFLLGIVVTHHFALEHECVHYTVFRTRWLNNLVGTICGLIVVVPFRHFRYEHCDHHTYTQIPGDDPELLSMPTGWLDYLVQLSGWSYWHYNLTGLWQRALGRLSEEERRFVPKVEHQAVIREARLSLGFYGLVGVAILAGWGWLLWFWLIPLVIAQPVMRAIRMSEHVGRPQVAEMSENTRTNLVSAPWRFLAWNMNYHAAHHYAASVPFHALPALHETLKDHVHIEPEGYLGAHKDILRQMRHG